MFIILSGLVKTVNHFLPLGLSAGWIRVRVVHQTPEQIMIRIRFTLLRQLFGPPALNSGSSNGSRFFHILVISKCATIIILLTLLQRVAGELCRYFRRGRQISHDSTTNGLLLYIFAASSDNANLPALRCLGRGSGIMTSTVHLI